ncbi:MAG: Rab family GTPase [Promethearchaeota archaeon]
MLKSLLKSRKLEKRANISILGPSQSGKTTLVKFLETGMPQLEVPLSTLGIEIRQRGVEIANWRFQLIDVGGQQVYQEVFWELAVEQANSFIYLIDATVRPENRPEIFEFQKQQYIYAMDLIPEDAVILILLNKQDLVDENPINPKEFGKIYPLDKLKARTVAFLPSSAKFGNGVEDAMLWFVSAMERSNVF